MVQYKSNININYLKIKTKFNNFQITHFQFFDWFKWFFMGHKSLRVCFQLSIKKIFCIQYFIKLTRFNKFETSIPFSLHLGQNSMQISTCTKSIHLLFHFQFFFQIHGNLAVPWNAQTLFLLCSECGGILYLSRSICSISSIMCSFQGGTKYI